MRSALAALVLLNFTACAGPPAIPRFSQSETEFRSKEGKAIRLEIKKSTERPGNREFQLTMIRFPGFHGGDVYLSLYEFASDTKVGAVGVGHGAMAPKDLPFFPPAGVEKDTWTQESPLLEVQDARMTIEWHPADRVETEAGEFRARQVVLTAHVEKRSIPVLRVWMAPEAGIVKFEHDGRLWTRSR